MILDFPPPVNQGLTAKEILTFDALAFGSAHDAALETLTILLETGRLFAFTAGCVSSFGHFLPEGFRILRQCIRDGLVPYILITRNVLTIVALTPTAVLLGCEAYAIQFETFGVFTCAD